MNSCNLNRRAFIKRATAMGASLALPVIIPASALGKNGAVAPSNRIVMGSIGVGNKGTANLKAFLNEAGVQVVAVCDVNPGSIYASFTQEFGRDPARRIVDEHYAEKAASGKASGCAA